jgi:hypothetical protein
MPPTESGPRETTQRRARARRIADVLFVALAIVGWWVVAEDGASPARLIAAVAASLAAVLQVFLPRRGRLLRRFRA